MADQSISIRLALIDGGKVKAELVDIGASGQKALERIRYAAQPASRGLQALDAAGTAVRGKMQEMAGSAGALGAGLTRLGPGGLAAAAGVGAVTVALGLVTRAAWSSSASKVSIAGARSSQYGSRFKSRRI